VCTRAYAHARTHARTHAARHSQRGNVRLDRARAARFTRVLNYTRLRDTGTEGVPPRLRRNRREGGGARAGWAQDRGPAWCREPRGCSSCLVGGIEIKIESLYTCERWRQMFVTLWRWILPRAEYLRRGVSRFNISYCAVPGTSRQLVMKTPVYVTPGHPVVRPGISYGRVRKKARGRIITAGRWIYRRARIVT
jgi:hypothetical protein